MDRPIVTIIGGGAFAPKLCEALALATSLPPLDLRLVARREGRLTIIADHAARALARLAREADAKVNLIPMNEHPGSPYRRPDDAAIDAFASELARAGITATVRRSRGDDIYAACGQLGNLGGAQAAGTSEESSFR